MNLFSKLNKLFSEALLCLLSFLPYLYERKIYSNGNYIHLKSVKLIGPYGIIINNKKINLNTFRDLANFKNSLKKTLNYHGISRILFFSFYDYGVIDDCCGYLVSRHGREVGQPNYAHFILENLTQLKDLKHWEKSNNQTLKIFTGPKPPDWVLEYLNLLGIKREQIKYTTKSLTKFKCLIVPKLHPINSSDWDFDLEGIKWIRERLSKELQKNKYPERIFISRQSISRRRIINYSELINILENFNFHVFEPQKMSVSEQYHLFNNAKILIGPSGAAWSNLIYSQNAHIIDLRPEYVEDSMYEDLALKMNLKYHKIETSHKVKSPTKSDDFIVNVEQLKYILNNIIQ